MKADLKKLSVSYRDQDHALLALDRVDLELRPGRVTALVGESGSGKTTLGRALMGMLPKNADLSGHIYLGGRDLAGLGETDLQALRWSETAMVFQNGAANLNPVHRLVDQVAEPLRLRPGTNREIAVREAENLLKAMGLSDQQGRRYPHELSGGQVQRALLAMALILDPPVLILDEPTAALDAMTTNFISGVVRNLRNRGKCILLITHDLGLAQNLADEIYVLYLGQVVEVLPARDLLHNPEHPYTLALGRSFPALDTVRDLGGIRGDAFYRVVHRHTGPTGLDHAHTHVAARGVQHDLGHGPSQGCLFQPRCTQAIPECRGQAVDFIQAGTHRVRCLRGGLVDLLEFQGVAKSYGTVEALQPTDLKIRAGEVFCLVGETGSGKTTLAMIAAGALPPDQGRLIFQDRDVADWTRRDYRSLAPQIGVVYQNPAEAVSHRLSVFDIVAEPLRIQEKHLSPDQVGGRVREALTDVRLSIEPEFLKRYPHELNLGAIQRLCLARALVHNPVLLVADEPTSALDPSVQAKVLKTLLGLQTEKGLTMIFVTHDIGLARKISDRIGVMLAGRLVEVGPAADLMARPGHPYTRMLIDSARGLVESFAAEAPPETDGCPFLDRCGRSRGECHLEPPAPVNLNSGRHLAWCRNPLARQAGPEFAAPEAVDDNNLYS